MLDADYIKTLVKKAAEFGNGKIHIIVNNAGFVSFKLLGFAETNSVAGTHGTV